MFSPDFNQVYQEAFASATGRDFLDENVQAEYLRDTERTVAGLLEQWTDPDFDSSTVTDFSEVRRSQTFRIKHPETSSFTEEDAEDIAQIRFLGRQVIRSARFALLENPNYDPSDPERFNSSGWRNAHPEVEFDQSFGYHSDAPSPQRLREWPEGEYVNCLGMAIAAAAESENQGIDYMFTNRLRTASYEMATITMQFLDRLTKLCPDVFMFENMMHEFEAQRAEANGEDEASVRAIKRCVMEDDLLDYIADHAYTLDTSFHHAIVRANEKEGDEDSSISEWRQVDPYGNVNADVAPRALDEALSQYSSNNELGTCNEILLLDGDMQELTSRAMATGIDLAIRSRRRLEKLVGDYSSPDVILSIKQELEKANGAIALNFIFEKEVINNTSDEFLFDRHTPSGTRSNLAMWMAMMGQIIVNYDEALTLYTKTIDDLVLRISNGSLEKANAEQVLCEAVSSIVFSSLKKNPSLRADFEMMILNMPFVYALHFAENRIKASLFAAGGDSDKSMEVGDPAFQVGSMYLNHYARWREDGIINVASELARVNPSQLLWQSAMSREGNLPVDDRVAAVGSLVKSLKRRQRHPLVNITR